MLIVNLGMFVIAEITATSFFYSRWPVSRAGKGRSWPARGADPLGARGQTYGRWAASWNEWALPIPAAENPVLDTTGEYYAQRQVDVVWFLAGVLVRPSCSDVQRSGRESLGSEACSAEAILRDCCSTSA